MDNKEQNRIFGLDVLRASAILFVMIIHAGAFVPEKIHPLYSYFIFDGVGVFFVLSGFLIGSILINQLENNGINLQQIKVFWLKRWSRTLPNYYLILTVLVIWDYLYSNQNINYHSYFLFTQNLFSYSKNNFFEWSWSLAVEEWFYLLLPVSIWLIYLLSKSVKLATLSVICLTIIFANYSRFSHFTNVESIRYETFKSIQYSVFTRLDGIIYGVLAAYIFYYNNYFWQKSRNILLAIGLLAFLLNFMYTHFLQEKTNYYLRTIELSIFPIIIFCFLPFLSHLKGVKNVYFFKIITFISSISYSLYLINSIVSLFLKKTISSLTIYLENNKIEISWSLFFIVSYLSFWVISIIISNIFYNKFEKRAIIFVRNKLFK